MNTGKKLEKHDFIRRYHLEGVYRDSYCDWDILEQIYEDYCKYRYEDYKQQAKALAEQMEREKPDEIHMVYGRAKNPEHLIEKIIRKKCKEYSSKYKDISVNNYWDKVRDLAGIRILLLKKENWRDADSYIRKKFGNKFAEPPIAYICYGDRDIFDSQIINTDYTNKGYRSQHYIINLKDHMYVEIQVRTLAEEVYGEFDHAARYPYREENRFLLRYGKIISKYASGIDEMISLCLGIGEQNLETLHEEAKEDRYVNWKKLDSNESNHSRSKYTSKKGTTAKQLILEKICRE